MKRTLTLLSLFLLPSLAFGAGFAQESIFLSKTPVVEGDTVLIHVVVESDPQSAFKGALVIDDGSQLVGSVPVNLAAADARVVSVSWTPAAGSHDITAKLVDSASTTLGSETQTFAVAQKPKQKIAATSSEAAAVESSAGIQDQIGNLSPAAKSATAPIFKVIDGARESAADVLDKQLASTKPKVGPTPGVVAGTSTIQIPDQQSWFWAMFYTVYFYILTILRFVVGSAAIFYPVLMAVVLYLLWRGFRRFRRD